MPCPHNRARLRWLANLLLWKLACPACGTWAKGINVRNAFGMFRQKSLEFEPRARADRTRATAGV